MPSGEVGLIGSASNLKPLKKINSSRISEEKVTSRSRITLSALENEYSKYRDKEIIKSRNLSGMDKSIIKLNSINSSKKDNSKGSMSFDYMTHSGSRNKINRENRSSKVLINLDIIQAISPD